MAGLACGLELILCGHGPIRFGRRQDFLLGLGLGCRLGWGFGLILWLHMRRIGPDQWLERLFSGGLCRGGMVPQSIEKGHDHQNRSEPKREGHHDYPHLQEGMVPEPPVTSR